MSSNFVLLIVLRHAFESKNIVHVKDLENCEGQVWQKLV